MNGLLHEARLESASSAKKENEQEVCASYLKLQSFITVFYVPASMKSLTAICLFAGKRRLSLQETM
jgi:hypothetical protein